MRPVVFQALRPQLYTLARAPNFFVQRSSKAAYQEKKSTSKHSHSSKKNILKYKCHISFNKKCHIKSHHIVFLVTIISKKKENAFQYSSIIRPITSPNYFTDDISGILSIYTLIPRANKFALTRSQLAFYWSKSHPMVCFVRMGIPKTYQIKKHARYTGNRPRWLKKKKRNLTSVRTWLLIFLLLLVYFVGFFFTWP